MLMMAYSVVVLALTIAAALCAFYSMITEPQPSAELLERAEMRSSSWPTDTEEHFQSS